MAVMEPAIVIMEAWKLSKMFSNSKFFQGILLKIHKQPCMEFLEGLLNPCPLLLQLSCLLNNNFIYQISAVCIFFFCWGYMGLDVFRNLVDAQPPNLCKFLFFNEA